MYKRKIERQLSEWLKTPNHKPIVIKGVRQCGKTSSVRQFAGQNFKNVIYLDFREHPEYKRFFMPNLDIDSIILRMSATPEYQNYEFEPGETCLIFDEIQDCPLARSSLKYFHLDGRYEVMCTGSLLGVSGYKSKADQKEEQLASIPVGFEEIIDMYPMDFEEWLWANGVKERVLEYLQNSLASEMPVDAAIHDVMMAHLRNYVMVGGMPEAVTCFMTTHKLNLVLRIQHRILNDYKSDMLKYATQADKARIIECFDSIPSQLAREYKKFSFAAVREGARGRDYAGCLKWVEDAGIIRRCYNIRTTELPLDGQRVDTEFKVYMADIGLLVAMLEEGTQLSIQQGALGSYKGAIYENLIADVFGKMGRKLYYFHRTSGLEIDFVIRHDGQCMPVECKASTGKAKSLQTVLKNREVYHVENALKFGSYNIGRENNVLTLPLYMAYLIEN